MFNVPHIHYGNVVYDRNFNASRHFDSIQAGRAKKPPAVPVFPL